MRPHLHPLSTGLGHLPRVPLITAIEGPLSSAANDGAGPPVRCGRCGHQHAAGRWSALELVERMSASRVRGHVTVWRTESPIEVRRCDSCKSPIARKQRADGNG